MAVDEALNRILKEMWRLDEKFSSGDTLTDSEKEFYNKELETIKNYYRDNNSHWHNRQNI